MKKVCVYTALFGAYDVGLPSFVNTLPEIFEFHCFTDQRRLTSSLWNMHYVDYPVANDVARSAYYYKWNPHKVFDGYDVVVWMDASAYDIKLGNINEEIKLFNSLGTAIHIEKHPSRSHSLLQECDVNCYLNKDDVGIMRKQVDGYYMEGYSDVLGILVPETGFSIRKYNDPRCVELSEYVWSQMGIGKTKRDQLVWNYSVWKTNLQSAVSMFTFDHKMMNLVKFKDHPHRAKHIQKVALVGPWLGDDRLESIWIDYVHGQLSNMPVDLVIVGCKTGHEKMYDKLQPNRIVASEPSGAIDRHLVDGNIPSFDISNTADREIIAIRPMTHIMTKIAKEFYE